MGRQLTWRIRGISGQGRYFVDVRLPCSLFIRQQRRCLTLSVWERGTF